MEFAYKNSKKFIRLLGCSSVNGLVITLAKDELVRAIGTRQNNAATMDVHLLLRESRTVITSHENLATKAKPSGPIISVARRLVTTRSNGLNGLYIPGAVSTSFSFPESDAFAKFLLFSAFHRGMVHYQKAQLVFITVFNLRLRTSQK